jgi:hypothetical protein
MKGKVLEVKCFIKLDIINRLIVKENDLFVNIVIPLRTIITAF